MSKNSLAAKLKGKTNQAVGAAREKVGDVSGNKDLAREGRAQHAKGDVQETVGKAKDNAKDAVQGVADAVKDAVDR